MTTKHTLCASLLSMACACGASRASQDAQGESRDSGTAEFAREPHTPALLESNFFVDVSEQSGIQDENFVADPTNPVPINDHSRLAFGDINGDGFDDIVMHSLFPKLETAGIPLEHLVVVNGGDGSFQHFSDESGLRHVQASFFAFADVDNDGDQDVFAGLDLPCGNLGNAMLLNDGAGHFTPVANAGIEGNAVAANAVFANFDGDRATLISSWAMGTRASLPATICTWGAGTALLRPQAHACKAAWRVRPTVLPAATLTTTAMWTSWLRSTGSAMAARNVSPSKK